MSGRNPQLDPQQATVAGDKFVLTSRCGAVAGLPWKQSSVSTPLTCRLLVAVLVGLLLLPLLPGSVVTGTGRGPYPSDGRPDGWTRVQVLIVLMSSSDRFGCKEM